MGKCVSKIKKKRKGGSEEVDPYTSFDDINNYEDVDNFSNQYENLPRISSGKRASTTSADIYMYMSPVLPTQRSITSVSRDSAYSETTNNCTSRNVSLSSLNQHDIDGNHVYVDSASCVSRITSHKQHTPYHGCSCRSCSQSGYVSTDRLVHNKTYSKCTAVSETSCCAKEEISMEEIPHMIDAFLPLLQSSIRVMDIIPHLPFIEDTVTFGNKDKDNPREAVILLINRLKASEEPGKWRAFLESLSRGGYKYIHDLLMGETEKDLTTHRKLLRLFTPRLIDRMDPQEFIDHLYERNVIDENDMQKIQCEERNRGPNAASLMLLECVPRKNPDWYDVFVDVLTKCGLEDLVDDFKIPDTEETAQTTCTCAASVTADDYLTPVYESEPDRPLPRGSPAGANDCNKTSANPRLEMTSAKHGDDENGNISGPNEGSLDLARMQSYRDRLYEQVKETKMKKALKKEINKLHQELLALQNYDENTEKETPETENTTNRNSFETEEMNPATDSTSILTESSSQTDDSYIMLTKIYTVLMELKAMVTAGGDDNGEQTNRDVHLKQPVTELATEEVDILSSPPPSHLVPIYSSRYMTSYIPQPHMTRLMSAFDSGFNTSQEYYSYV